MHKSTKCGCNFLIASRYLYIRRVAGKYNQYLSFLYFLVQQVFSSLSGSHPLPSNKSQNNLNQTKNNIQQLASHSTIIQKEEEIDKWEIFLHLLYIFIVLYIYVCRYMCGCQTDSKVNKRKTERYIHHREIGTNIVKIWRKKRKQQ